MRSSRQNAVGATVDVYTAVRSDTVTQYDGDQPYWRRERVYGQANLDTATGYALGTGGPPHERGSEAGSRYRLVLWICGNVRRRWNAACPMD